MYAALNEGDLKATSSPNGSAGRWALAAGRWMLAAMPVPQARGGRRIEWVSRV